MGLATALTLGAATVGAVGAISSGKAKRREAEFRSNVSRQTAFKRAGFIEEESEAQAGFIEETAGLRAGFTQEETEAQALILRQQAQREREIAQALERDFRRERSQDLAERRAALGGSGVRTDVGSPVTAIGDFVREAELQALRIRSSGELSATRLEQSARLLKKTGRLQAGITRQRAGKQAELIRKSGRTEAGLIRSAGATEASLLGQAGRAAERRGFFRAGSTLLSGGATAFS